MHCRLFPSGRRLSRCPESNIAIPWGPSSRAAKRTSRGPRRPIKRGFAPFSLSFLLIPLLHTSLHSSYPHSTLHSSFAVSLLALVASAAALGPNPVLLGTSGNYAVLAQTGVSTVPESTIIGDTGLSPAATTYYTGFNYEFNYGTTYATSGQVVGKLYAASMTSPTSSVLTTAVSDMQTAFTDASSRSGPDYLNLGAGTVGGYTLAPGLYNWGSTIQVVSDLIINGTSNDNHWRPYRFQQRRDHPCRWCPRLQHRLGRCRRHDHRCGIPLGGSCPRPDRDPPPDRSQHQRSSPRPVRCHPPERHRQLSRQLDCVLQLDRQRLPQEGRPVLLLPSLND